MLNSGKEILGDIDATIDQLIANASAMKNAFASDVLTHEIEALQKTQESLLARLMHRHALLQSGRKKTSLASSKARDLRRKIIDYDKVHARLMAEAKKQFIHKNRRRSLKLSKGAKRVL